MSDSEASETAWEPQSGTHPSINLPLAFKIYCRKSRLTHSEFYIGHEKNNKLHAIAGGHKGWFRPTIKLHAGPSIETPVLGSALLKNKTIEITLPSSGEHILHESDVKLSQKLKSSSTEFEFDLPVKGIPAPEHFEWHRSKGPEVESLHGRGKSGWVLLRVGHGADLGEPVAAYSVDLCSIKLSGHFAFFNSGATSELGADFAVMAVVSALSLGQKMRDAYTTGAVIAGMA